MNGPEYSFWLLIKININSKLYYTAWMDDGYLVEHVTSEHTHGFRVCLLLWIGQSIIGRQEVNTSLMKLVGNEMKNWCKRVAYTWCSLRCWKISFYLCPSNWRHTAHFVGYLYDPLCVISSNCFLGASWWSFGYCVYTGVMQCKDSGGVGGVGKGPLLRFCYQCNCSFCVFSGESFLYSVLWSVHSNIQWIEGGLSHLSLIVLLL